MLRKGFKASSFTLESIHLRAIHSPLKAIHYDTFTEVLLETAKVLLRESATDYNLRRHSPGWTDNKVILHFFLTTVLL